MGSSCFLDSLPPFVTSPDRLNQPSADRSTSLRQIGQPSQIDQPSPIRQTSQISPRRAAQISKSDQHKRLAPLKRTRDGLPGHAMDCSLKDSLQGLRGTPQRFHPTQRTGFLIPQRAGPTATGKLHCSIHNHLRVAQATLHCKHRTAVRLASLQLSENNNDLIRWQAASLWKEPPICGKQLRLG